MPFNNPFASFSSEPNQPVQDSQPTPFAFQKKQAELDMRKLKLAQLMRQEMSQKPAEGSVAKGAQGTAGNPDFIGSTVYNQPDQYVPPSWVQHLQSAVEPIANRYMANRESEQLGQAQQEFDAADRRAAIEHAMNQPMSTSTPPTVQMDDEGNPYPNVVTAPTNQAVSQWEQEGLAIPSRRELISKMIEDRALNEPIREEARATRKEDREDRQVEAKNKLEAELKYKRERDEEERKRQVKHDQDMLTIRREIAAGRGAPGEKASDYRQEVAEDGSISYFNPVTGVRREGGQGKPSSTYSKDQITTRNALEAADTAIAEEKHVKELLDKGSSSGLKADMRRRAAYAFPETAGGPELEADEALKVIADKYLKSVPRFEGPQSDKDTQSYKEAAGQLANTYLPPATRKKAHEEVIRLTKKSRDQMRARSTFQGDTNARKNDLKPGVVDFNTLPK